MIKKYSGLIQVHIAILLMAGTTLFPKLISLPPHHITALRSLIGLPLLLLLNAYWKTPIRLKNRRDVGWAIVIGILLALHWVTFFHSIQVSTVAIGTISTFTFPIITVFLEPMFLRHRLSWRDVSVAIMVLIGILLLIPHFSFADSTFAGVFWGLVSAFLYSMRNMLQKKYLNGYSGSTSMVYQMAVVGLLISPWLTWDTDLTIDNRWVYLIILGVVFTAIPHALFLNGMRTLRVKTASLISCLQPLYAVTLAAMVLSEQPDWHTYVGGLIIIAASIIETYIATRETSQKSVKHLKTPSVVNNKRRRAQRPSSFSRVATNLHLYIMGRIARAFSS